MLRAKFLAFVFACPLAASLVSSFQTSGNGYCAHTLGGGGGVNPHDPTTLVINAQAESTADYHQGIGEFNTCGFSVVGTVFTEGPPRAGFLELTILGWVEGNGGVPRSASITISGIFSAGCQESCSPVYSTVPIVLGSQLSINQSAYGSSQRTKYGNYGGGGTINTTLRAYELISSYNPIKSYVAFVDNPIPEPSTLACCIGAIFPFALRQAARKFKGKSGRLAPSMPEGQISKDIATRQSDFLQA